LLRPTKETIMGADSSSNHFQGEDFMDAFKSSVIDGMTRVLGQSGTRSMFFHLKLDEYLERPGEVHDRIRSMFKDGSVTLERAIVLDLFKKLDIPVSKVSARGEFDFVKCVRLARNSLSER
jgi:hypothetical protein